MSQRTALILSALMTVLILASIAVFSNAVQAKTPASPLPQPTPIVQVVATLQADQTEPTALPTPEPMEPIATVTPEYPVSNDQATDIALRASPGKTLSGTADLVSFQGVVAYEVALNTGKVYVDAHTGKVIFNGALVASGPVNQDQAIEIASTYMQSNGGVSEVIRVRFGRMRQLRGLQVFEVTFAKGTRVYINKNTGEVALVSKPEDDE